MAVVLGVMASLSIVTYWKGIAVYRGAHAFNDQLVAVYSNPVASDQEVALTYPNVAFARQVRATMSRYSLGPYRFRTARSERLAEAAPFIQALRLENSVVLRQRFRASHDDLNALELQFVTWQTAAPDLVVGWSLYDVSGGKVVRVGTGQIDTAGINDWGYVRLAVDRQAQSAQREYELVLQAPAVRFENNLIGVPLFGPTNAQSVRGQSGDGRALTISGTLGVLLKYGD